MTRPFQILRKNSLNVYNILIAMSATLLSTLPANFPLFIPNQIRHWHPVRNSFVELLFASLNLTCILETALHNIHKFPCKCCTIVTEGFRIQLNNNCRSFRRIDIYFHFFVIICGWLYFFKLVYTISVLKYLLLINNI